MVIQTSQQSITDLEIGAFESRANLTAERQISCLQAHLIGKVTADERSLTGALYC